MRIDSLYLIVQMLWVLTGAKINAWKYHRKRENRISCRPIVDDIQSAMSAFLGLIVIGAVSVYCDYRSQGKIGVNSYSNYLF